MTIRTTRKTIRYSLYLAISIAVVLSPTGFGLGSIKEARALTHTPQKAWVTDGVVSATTRVGNTVYLGGNFSEVRPHTGYGAPVNDATGAALGGFSKFNGIVNDVVSDGAGGWYVGGDFTRVGDYSISGVAHIQSGGVVDPGFGTLVAGTVNAVAFDGTSVYIGGDFTAVNGVARANLAALQPASGSATGWNPGANASVLDILVDSATVYVGGAFTAAGGASRNYIAAINGGGAATGWNPDADGEVLALITQGGSIFAGGNFMTIGGALRDSLAELDSTGTATGWDPGTDGSVFALESDGTNLFVGGSFTTLAGAGRNNTGAVNLISGTTTGFNPNAVSAVNALAASGGQVFVGGAFVGLGAPASRNRLAAIDLSTGSVLPWNPGANDVVNALATDGTNIYAGGFFTNIAGVSRNRIASLGSSTGTATGWNPDANAFVNALAVNGGVVYAGGGFTTIGGAARSYLAALDASGSATAWNPGANATVNALALDGQTLYVGGGFILVDGQLRLYAAALDTAALSSPYVTGWTADADATVLAIAHDTNNVYLGGNFANLAGSARSFVGSVAKSGGLTSFNPGPDAPVLALGNEQTNLYTGGDFGSLGGGARSGVALLDTSAGLAGWNLQLDRYNQTAYDVLPGSADFIAGGTLGQAASFGYVAYFTKPTVQFDTSASAGLETVTPSSIEVTLSAPDTQDTLVTYSVTGGSATNGADYTLATGVVTIPAGSTSAIISLPIIDDTLIEGDETVVLTLSGPSVNAVLGAPSQHTYTIQENDLGPGAGGPNTNTVTRIPGDTPLEQAIEFSQRRFSTSGSAQAAIITRDDIVVDAFASSPLSNRLDATLLLTNSGGLDSSVLAELNRAISGAQSPIYLSGGLAALSAQVEQDLRNAGYTNINRFAGANRRETARLIADEIMVQNTSPTDTAFVTEDQAFVDSLVIGAVAGRDTDSIVEPVLLNPRGDSAVDQHLAGFLSVHPEITKLQIIGGTSAVAAGLESALQATGRTVTRTAGADRYETNIAVVNANFTAPARVVVARGDKGGIAGAKMVQASQAVSEQFFAALLASAFAADFEMPLLLVTPDSVPGPISQYLSGNALAINDVFIVGSTGEISSGVEATIGSLI